MKKSVLVILLAGMITAACADPLALEQQTEVQVPQGLPKVQMTAAPVLFADSTKTVMNVDETGLSFVWQTGDVAGVYSAASLASFLLNGGAGTNSASFDGGGFTLTDQETYRAFFPYNGNALDKTAIPLDYSSQSATADNDIVSPMSRDYMWAEAVSDNGNASFNFKHISSFVRLKMDGLTPDASISKVQLIPMYDEMVEEATYDITTKSITPMATKPSLEVSTTGVTVPSSGISTVWAMMAPHDFSADAVAVAATIDGKLYSGRLDGSNQISGKAYRWNVSPLASTSAPDHGITATLLDQVQMPVDHGNYSGIFYLDDKGDGTYDFAVVDDKLKGGGVVFFTIPIDAAGVVTAGGITMDVPAGTSSGAASIDNEDVVFDGSSLWVSAEKNQTIRPYSVSDGSVASGSFAIPSDMGTAFIASNAGFEALTYCGATGKFWTTTELPLKKDASLPRFHRLQRFGASHNPDARYLYQMDEPTKSAAEISAAKAYVFGIPAMTALPDRRLIVLEREVYVPNISGLGDIETVKANTFARVKLYVVDPTNDGAGILRKKLLAEFSTGIEKLEVKMMPLSLVVEASLANYEGMCLGPVIGGKQSLVLIADSQGGMPMKLPYLGTVTLTQEYIKVILLENL